MNKVLAIIIINLLFFHLPVARANVDRPQNDGAKSPELVEASRLSQQVVKLYNEKKYDEALPIAKRALEIRERVLGQDDALVAEAVQNLASLYFGKKNYAEALSLYKRALSILEKVNGPESAKLANTLDILGWLYYAERNSSKAEEVFRRALQIREKALGPDNEETGRSAYMLAQFYQRAGEYGKAVNYYKRAVEVEEKASKPNDEQLADLIDKCACAMLQNKQTKEAGELFRRSYRIRKKTPFENIFSDLLLKGKATYRAEPAYPLEARRSGVSGSVVVEVTVDETGKVIDAKAMCGPEPLIPATIEAARRWRFTPSLLSGKAVKIVGTITFNFRL